MTGQFYTERVLMEVVEERKRQIDHGYTLEHDDKHNTVWFAGLAAQRLALMEIFPRSQYRRLMIQAIAMLVANVEKIDREGEKNGNGN